MSSFNPLNVIWMNYQEFIARSVELTEVTERERSLKHKVIKMLTIQNTVKMENNEKKSKC